MESLTPSVARPAERARWWHWEGDRVACTLCPRACKVGAGQRGFCFSRKATEEGMALTDYGRSSGFCLDPVESSPLYHFYPGARVLAFGTAGCNLACRYCQNWDIARAESETRLLDEASPERIAEAARRLGCKSIAFGFNDPVLWAEYALDVAAAAHEQGVLAFAKTAGYITDAARAEFFGGLDAASVDLKGFTEDFYRKICGGRLGPVKDTLVYLARETGVWLEVSTLLIPGENDSDAELHALCAWMREALGPDVPLHFSAYTPDYKLHIPATPAAVVSRARQIGLEEGIRFVYAGNVPTVQGRRTSCPDCGAALISRTGNRITGWGLREGRCGACASPIPGRFDADPGPSVPRRRGVRLGPTAS